MYEQKVIGDDPPEPAVRKSFSKSTIIGAILLPSIILILLYVILFSECTYLLRSKGPGSESDRFEKLNLQNSNQIKEISDKTDKNKIVQVDIDKELGLEGMDDRSIIKTLKFENEDDSDTFDFTVLGEVDSAKKTDNNKIVNSIISPIDFSHLSSDSDDTEEDDEIFVGNNADNYYDNVGTGNNIPPILKNYFNRVRSSMLFFARYVSVISNPLREMEPKVENSTSKPIEYEEPVTPKRFDLSNFWPLFNLNFSMESNKTKELNNPKASEDTGDSKISKGINNWDYTIIGKTNEDETEKENVDNVYRSYPLLPFFILPDEISDDTTSTTENNTKTEGKENYDSYQYTTDISKDDLKDQISKPPQKNDLSIDLANDNMQTKEPLKSNINETTSRGIDETNFELFGPKSEEITSKQSSETHSTDSKNEVPNNYSPGQEKIVEINPPTYKNDDEPEIKPISSGLIPQEHSKDLRNMYYKFKNFTVPNPDICPYLGDDTFLLIGIHSRSSSFKERAAIRETWGRISNLNDFNYAFLIGVSNSPDVNNKLLDELEEYGDIIQINVLDEDGNLDAYPIMFLKWIKQYCRKVKYVINTQDNVFLNLPLILQALRSTEVNDNAILGKLFENIIPDRISSHKNYISKNLYEPDIYPKYLGNEGYLLPGKYASIIYDEAENMPYFPHSNILITGIISDKLNIPRENISKYFQIYSNISTNEKCSFLKYYAVYPLTSKQILSFWNEMKETGFECYNFINDFAEMIGYNDSTSINNTYNKKILYFLLTGDSKYD